MRRRWAEQATQRQAQLSGTAGPSLNASPCIDLSSQAADSASLADELPETLDYEDIATPRPDPPGEVGPTQLDSPCISVCAASTPLPQCSVAAALSIQQTPPAQPWTRKPPCPNLSRTALCLQWRTLPCRRLHCTAPRSLNLIPRSLPCNQRVP